jgi:DNA polymerase gamma 1
MSWKKIPHPKNPGENCGGVLSKDFVEDMATGTLSSDLPEAKRALDIANSISFWTSVRKRVMSRIFKEVPNPYGKEALVTLPEIVVHGTLTRRTVENLMATMCKTKDWRIGTELKTRIQAPDGWNIISADYDAQELNIAGIYSDLWEGGFVGCSPMGFQVLSGSKDSGTDPHTSLARSIIPSIYKDVVWPGDGEPYIAEPEVKEPESEIWKNYLSRSVTLIKDMERARDLSKFVGFSILYGSGARGIQETIKRFYPDKTDAEVKMFALNALAKKKGKQVKGVYVGGTDSGAFNVMEDIAMRQKVPQLPCLGTKISTALRPSAVGNDFRTGRTNWAIQASGAEILSITLTAVDWLAKEYRIPYRFVISIHDELHFMVPEKFAEQFAVVFQIAHMYTWSLFHSQVKIPELPLSRAFFSGVSIDNRIRKSPTEKTVTPSNPNGHKEKAGVEYSMTGLQKLGAIDKLKTRFSAVQKGLIT